MKFTLGKQVAIRIGHRRPGPDPGSLINLDRYCCAKKVPAFRFASAWTTFCRCYRSNKLG